MCPHAATNCLCGLYSVLSGTTASLLFARHRAKSDELGFVAYGLFLRVLVNIMVSKIFFTFFSDLNNTKLSACKHKSLRFSIAKICIIVYNKFIGKYLLQLLIILKSKEVFYA